ncbi:hypothetical protein EKE94_04940 [Mesobaculum littorinae]|uniref:Uncharacterized protein n=1 Tax=Mesobaculum littorinae TaxID=2486419 RepID=A0A438AHT1_9RHOB|nr:hypothetical protein [Mesobaculum littorinae]RVV98279.1 hypothetical protein EKE94_04940 [Mesobaculum littorinae]
MNGSIKEPDPHTGAAPSWKTVLRPAPWTNITGPTMLPLAQGDLAAAATMLENGFSGFASPSPITGYMWLIRLPGGAAPR